MNISPCSTDIDECTLRTHQCVQNCRNTVGSYTCSCQTGYSLGPVGQHCDGIAALISILASPLSHLCTDIDECRLGTHQCAQNCSNTVGSYTCSCRTGYRLSNDGQTCISEFKHFHWCIAVMLYIYPPLLDIDECAERISQCHQVCHDTPGSYSCSCRPGYDLNSDGRQCDSNLSK